MPSKNGADPSPEFEKQIAGIESMTLEELRTLSLSAWDEITAGTITSRQGNAINRAVRNRLRAIKQEHRTPEG